MEIPNAHSGVLYVPLHFPLLPLPLPYSSGTKLQEELDHYEDVVTNQLKLQIRRPNNMNNYGIVLGIPFRSFFS
jgi:hypothetical protein